MKLLITSFFVGILFIQSCAMIDTNKIKLKKKVIIPKDAINLMPANMDGGQLLENLSFSIDSIQRRTFFPKSKQENDSLRKAFSPNDYFKVLKNIKLKEGYNLDYIINSDFLGSFPLLIAMDPNDQKFFKDLKQLTSAPSKDSIEMIRKRIDNYTTENCIISTENPDLSLSVYCKDCIGYLFQLESEHNPQAYLEYCLLKIMGGQFLLFWHAGYNDYEIISSKSALSKKLKKIGSSTITKDLEEQLLIDINPEVYSKENSIFVRMVVFTNWGGLEEKIFEIERNKNSIKLVGEMTNTLYKYDCGISF